VRNSVGNINLTSNTASRCLSGHCGYISKPIPLFVVLLTFSGFLPYLVFFLKNIFRYQSLASSIMAATYRNNRQAPVLIMIFCVFIILWMLNPSFTRYRQIASHAVHKATCHYHYMKSHLATMISYEPKNGLETPM
jgi:hypothetical protein